MKYLFALLILLSLACSPKSDPMDKLRELIKSGKDVYIENVDFSGDLDLTTFLEKNLISEGVYQAKTSSSITFNNCRFDGKVIAFHTENNTSTVVSFLSNVSFINCRFGDEVNFRGSSILGRTDFTKSVFAKKVSFEECTFYQNAYFNGCTFNDESRFQNAFFIKNGNFSNAKFQKIASFQSATFNSGLQFLVASFYQFADFSLIKCKDDIFFNYAEFNDKCNFSNSSFAGSSNFLNARFTNADFKNCLFIGELNLSKVTLSEFLDFDHSHFITKKPDLSFLPKEKININRIQLE
jgi:uncharacterized protein YjbI with pentapeptide repeats